MEILATKLSIEVQEDGSFFVTDGDKNLKFKNSMEFCKYIAHEYTQKENVVAINELISQNKGKKIDMLTLIAQAPIEQLLGIEKL